MITMTEKEAIKAKPGSGCPESILGEQVLVPVRFFNFQGEEGSGQIVVNKAVKGDIIRVFDLIYKIRFPLGKVVPIAHPDYAWDDEKSCNDNNSSAFNYRKIAMTDRLSNHSFGLAIDLNPIQNQYMKYDKDLNVIFKVPEYQEYDINMPGTLYKEHPVVMLLNNLGWTWGGDWTKESGRIDYQHFEKTLNN